MNAPQGQAAASMLKCLNDCLFVEYFLSGYLQATRPKGYTHLPLGSVWYLSFELVMICLAFF